MAAQVELYDFATAELLAREPLYAKRIRLVRVALKNQRDDLLAFAGVLDAKLEAIAQAHALPMAVVRQACVLQRKPETSSTYWEGWCRLCAQMSNKCYAVFEAVLQAMAETPRCSSMVESLNSRLRNYFSLRRQLGVEYLCLLQFFLNHRTFLRSRARGQKPQAVDDGASASALANAAWVRTAAASASLTRRGSKQLRNFLYFKKNPEFLRKISPRLRYPKWRFLNYAVSLS